MCPAAYSTSGRTSSTTTLPSSSRWKRDTTAWLDDFRQIVADHRTAAGDYPAGAGQWRDEFRRTGLFEDLDHIQVTHEQTLDRDDFLALVASWSWIANLESTRRQAVVEEVRGLVQEDDEIVIPYQTDLHLGRLRARAA